MKKKTRRRRHVTPLPLMMAELAFASWETIARRTQMIAAGTCSPREYNRMVREKAQAAYASGLAFACGVGSPAAALAPWHRRATANAKRLRRRK